MKMAKRNTDKNLETCGVLAGSLVSLDSLKVGVSDISTYNPHGSIISALQKNRKFYVTALIIPKQESTSDSVWQFHHGLSSAIAYWFCYYISLTGCEFYHF